MNWTQPVCANCWDEKNPDRKAMRVVGNEEAEHCCYCNALTWHGIYVRIDPRTVKYPKGNQS